MEPSRHLFVALMATVAIGAMLLPAAASAESLHVVFPQTAQVTVVQGSTANFTLEVQAYGATGCDADHARVRINTIYSVDAAGDIASGLPADIPIQTGETRGSSANCDITNPVVVPLTATAASTTPVGDYTSVIRYGKGGDGDIDLDGPVLTIHVVAPPPAPAAPVVIPPPALAPPQIIVLGERIVPKPVLGKSFKVELVKGTVTYRVPGQAVTTLTGSVIVPNGTRIDATDGVVKVTVVRDSTGTLDTVDAWGGGFKGNQAVEKSGRGLTTFTLSDSLSVSKKGANAARVARVAKVAGKRSLWVNGKGNFKTRGKRASAIVRGTYWLTQETDAGTKVAVKRGLVAVRDLVRKKTVLVSTGQSYTAKLRSNVARRVPAFTGRAS